MFERRLKIFLSILLVFVLVLLGRAMQLQIIQRDYWAKQASDSMRREQLTDAPRGRIVDSKGAVLAQDQPCTDACVDYRLIIEPPDDNLIRLMVDKRVKERYGDEYTHSSAAQRREMIKNESALLTSQIHVMWDKLARLSNTTRAEIDERRKAIQDRVEMRRRSVWYQKYQRATSDHATKEEPPWYRRWIMGEKTDVPDIDDIANEKLVEEQSPHVILEAIDTDTLNELQKHADEYPGLTLQPATHRAYPYGAAACHIIGRLGKVWREDIETDPNFGDELRSYGPNDIKGRDGLELLGEPTLRGTRGSTVFDGVTNKIVSSAPPRPGEDLRATIDIDLQMQIEEMFTRVLVPYDMGYHRWQDWKSDTVAMHGAAVVIEIETGDVKALVSAPGFDPNTFDKEYAHLVADKLSAPLLNRATQSMLEPGSTVKPVVGAGAITDHLLGVNEGIECTGYLQLNGRVYKGFGKCWTANTARLNHLDNFAHHPFPWDAPHRGHDGNPDGFLTYSDALERSCNVFFETTADRLGLDELANWMRRFGLGRPTGIGIAEVKGRLPTSYKGPNRQFATWSAGIGQGPVGATPLQMCNIAATIARRGIWVRPNLVQSGQNVTPYKPKKVDPDDATWDDIPSRIDLHLDPAAINAAFDGMTRVVNSQAGTGSVARRPDMLVAGKTGTAQAAPILIPGQVDGEAKMVPLPPATHWDPQPEHPWYRAIDKEREHLNHAWFIGFVPADHPKYAISVMVEYGGGGGGSVAGPIVYQIIDALVEHGYLHPTGRAKDDVTLRD